MIERECPIAFQTHGPGHHFFGYYDKSPIDRAGERLLTHRADFDFQRMPRESDEIAIGFWTLADGRYHELARTRAYNWQQGSQLQWLGPDYGRHIIFNDRSEDHFVSRILDVESGEERVLPYPVYTVHPNGRSAICVNYERIYFPRPGYRYEGIIKREWDQPLPEGDGLFRLDLESGELQPIVTTRQLYEHQHLTSMEGCTQYLEHALMSPDGSRFCFFHVWQLADGGFYTRLYSADEFGGDLRLLSDGGMVSHCGWRGNDQISAWARPASAVSSLRKNKALTRNLIRPLLPLYHRLNRTLGLTRGQLTGDTYFLPVGTVVALLAFVATVTIARYLEGRAAPVDARHLVVHQTLVAHALLGLRREARLARVH